MAQAIVNVGEIGSFDVRQSDVLWKDRSTFQAWIVSGSLYRPIPLSMMADRVEVVSWRIFASELPDIDPTKPPRKGIVLTVETTQFDPDGSMSGLLWQRGGGSFNVVTPTEFLEPPTATSSPQQSSEPETKKF